MENTCEVMPITFNKKTDRKERNIARAKISLQIHLSNVLTDHLNILAYIKAWLLA